MSFNAQNLIRQVSSNQQNDTTKQYTYEPVFERFFIKILILKYAATSLYYYLTEHKNIFKCQQYINLMLKSLSV